MYGFFPSHGLDHINGEGLDNRIVNLREADQGVNMKNTSRRVDNMSGVTGVHWYKNRKKWQAQIQVNGKRIFLGYFDDIDDAIAVRKLANIKYGFHNNHGNTKAAQR